MTAALPDAPPEWDQFCQECERAIRPRSTRAKDAPWAVTSWGRGLCYKCGQHAPPRDIVAEHLENIDWLTQPGFPRVGREELALRLGIAESYLEALLREFRPGLWMQLEDRGRVPEGTIPYEFQELTR